jgi:uncharacterized membrane protein YphA (DoxX/SURF4 family)
MDKMLAFFKRFDTPASTHTFGLFRILYACYNLGLIYQLFSNWPLYFDHIAPISLSYFPVKLSLMLWTMANIQLVTGTFTRFAAVANYVFVVIMAAYFSNIKIASFNDDLLRIGGFLLIFLPAGKSFSVDAVVNRFYSKQPNKTTSNLYYLLTILVSLGLLYFASGISKLFSPMWQKGIGLWIPAVIPSYKWNTFSFFVDQQWLMYSLNYLVITFELLFVVLLFKKKIHPLIVLIGIGFHLGIALLFPFYYISFGPIFYYSLFIPSSWWTKLKNKIRVRNPLHISYNPTIIRHVHASQLLRAFNYRHAYVFVESTNQTKMVFGIRYDWEGFLAALEKSFLLFPLSFILKIKNLQYLAEYASENWLPQHFEQNEPQPASNRFRRFVFFIFIAALCWVQLLSLGYHTYTALKADNQKRERYLQQRVALQDFSTKPSNLARTFFGINSRGVFLDHAFNGSKTVFALALMNPDGTEKWLPVFTPDGYVTGDNIGLRWHKLSFKYFGRTQTQPDTIGFQKYTLLWAKKQHLPLQQMNIRVYRRIYPCPTEYETGYLAKMLALPWDTVGVIHWKDSVFTYENLKPDTAFNQ